MKTPLEHASYGSPTLNRYATLFCFAVIAVGALCNGIYQIANQYAHITTKQGVIELYGPKTVRNGWGMVLLSLSPLGLLTRTKFIAATWALVLMTFGFGVIISIHRMPN